MNATATDAELEVRNLPRLDEAPIAKAAQAWVTQRLSEHTDPEARATAAAKIVATEGRAADRARAARDAAAHTIVTRYRVRRGADIAGALGVNRTRWKAIRDSQAELDPAPVDNAPEVLPNLAAAAEKHAQRAEAARVARDEAAGVLLAEGRSNAEVAKMIGVDPSRVSHIKHREQVA